MKDQTPSRDEPLTLTETVRKYSGSQKYREVERGRNGKIRGCERKEEEEEIRWRRGYERKKDKREKMIR